jgi:hypothetical protein
MRARQLITVSGTIHGPETLRVIIKAFDSAWADLAPSISVDSGEAQACQLKLATIILAEAYQERRDAMALKNTALRQLHAPQHWWRSPVEQSKRTSSRVDVIGIPNELFEPFDFLTSRANLDRFGCYFPDRMAYDRARQTSMYLAHRLTGHSLVEIAVRITAGKPSTCLLRHLHAQLPLLYALAENGFEQISRRHDALEISGSVIDDGHRDAAVSQLLD